MNAQNATHYAQLALTAETAAQAQALHGLARFWWARFNAES